MSSNTSSTRSGGVGIVGLLTVAFVILKLTHVIAWSWWWVFAPLWISAGIWAVVFLVSIIVIALVASSHPRR